MIQCKVLTREVGFFGVHMGVRGGPPSIYHGGTPPLRAQPPHRNVQYRRGYVPPLRGVSAYSRTAYRYLVLNIRTDALTLHRHSQYAQ